MYHASTANQHAENPSTLPVPFAHGPLAELNLATDVLACEKGIMSSPARRRAIPLATLDPSPPLIDVPLDLALVSYREEQLITAMSALSSITFFFSITANLASRSSAVWMDE